MEHNQKDFSMIILSIMGCGLASVGASGVIMALFRAVSLFISSPTTVVGGTLYFIVGAYTSLSCSQTLRLRLRKLFPKKALVLLFEKSLIDCITSCNSSSKSASSGYVLMAMTMFLDKSDIEQLIAALPGDFDFLRRPGLVHMLPKILRDVLGSSNEVMMSRAAGDDSQILQATSRSHTEDNHIDAPAFFSLPHHMKPEGVSESNGSPEAPSGDGHSSTDSPRQESFEDVLKKIINGHINRTVEGLYADCVRRISSALNFVAMGGNVSDEWLLSAVVASGGVAAASNYILCPTSRSSGSIALLSDQINTHPATPMASLLRRLLYCVGSICGLIIANRIMNRTVYSGTSLHPSSARGASTATASTENSSTGQQQPTIPGPGGGIVNRWLRKIYCSCKKAFYNDTSVSTFASALAILLAASATTIIAKRLRRPSDSIKWIFCALFGRLRTEIFSLLDTAIEVLPHFRKLLPACGT